MVEFACGVDMVFTPPPGLGIAIRLRTVIVDWPNDPTTYRLEKVMSQRSATVLCRGFTIHEVKVLRAHHFRMSLGAGGTIRSALARI